MALREHIETVEARSGSIPAARCAGFILRAFLRAYPDPGSVRGLDVERWAYRRRKRGGRASGSTVRNRLSALAAWYRFLLRAGLVTGDPCAGVPRPRSEPPLPRGLTADQWGSMLRVIEGRCGCGRQACCRCRIALRDRAIVVVLTLTALRRTECASLTPAGLENVGGAWLYSVRTKGGRQRRHELPGAAVTAIDLWLHARGRRTLADLPRDLPLFGIGPDMICHLVKRYGRLARLGNVTPHVLRHTAAQLRAEDGQSTRSIQNLLGHQHERTTETYLARLRGERDPGAAAVAARLGLESHPPRTSEEP